MARQRVSNARVPCVPFDESETEDIVLVRAAFDRRVEGGVSRRVDVSDVADATNEDASPNPVTTPVVSREPRNRPPRRIGNGKLVATRVHWRPGDPFGQATRSPMRGFEWNRMVKSACVTAACGLILVWLLHIA